MVTIPEDDRMSILNEVANRVEVMLREGSFAALAGLPVRFVTLVIGLTCEKGADVRIRKTRSWRSPCSRTSASSTGSDLTSCITFSAVRRFATWQCGTRASRITLPEFTWHCERNKRLPATSFSQEANLRDCLAMSAARFQPRRSHGNPP